ncbi:MAG: cohesin domain-containing protein [Candidatus Bathyarchaeia archaeon]
MKKLLVYLMLTFLLCSFSFTKVSSNPAEGTSVEVISEVNELGPEYIVGQEFSVAVIIKNVSNLYGLDVRIYINETYFEYVNHTTTIPVEDYPNPIDPSPYPGILHEPVTESKDEYDSTTKQVRIAYSSQSPADPFTGNGTVCIINLRVINQPVGQGFLNVTAAKFVSIKLAGYAIPPPPIPYASQDLIIKMYYRQMLTIINPTSINPTYTQSGKDIQVTYNYTEINPQNVSIKIFNATHTIATREITTLDGGINIQRTDEIAIPDGAAEGSYDMSITMFNANNESQIVIQTNAIKVDNTEPSISNPYQDPPGLTMQPGSIVEVDVGQDVTVRVNVTDASPIKQVLLYYNVTTTDWENITMQLISGNQYEATIPSSQFAACTTIYYYITATDYANNTVQTPGIEIYFQYHIVPELVNMLMALLILMTSVTLITIKKKK